MKIEKILNDLIKFNTVEDKENKKIIKWIAGYLKPMGFKIKIQKNKKQNLFASIGPAPIITFIGHTDTVPPGAGWTKNPFQLTSEKDRLYGLGACDMKGGIAAMLSAVSEIGFKRFKSGINLLFTYDEEIGFAGIKKYLLKKQIDTKYFIIGEPTNCAPFIASKGVCSFKLEFIGKSYHGSEPDKGVNAIVNASRFIIELEKKFRTIRRAKDKIFSPALAVLNIAKINGGDAINKIPDKCRLELECRTVAKNQAGEILKLLKSIAPRYGAKIKMDFSLAPIINKNQNFIEYLEKITKQKRQSSNYITEASFLGNKNFVILGPGPINAHIADEWASKRQVYKAAELYAKIIQDLEDKNGGF